MKIKTLLVLLLMAIVSPLLASAQTIHYFDEAGKVQLTDLSDEAFGQVGTDGEYVYFWDNSKRSIMVYSFFEDTFSQMPDEVVMDLHARGQYAVFKDGDRSDGFMLVDAEQEEFFRIGTETSVDNIVCMSSFAMAYTFENELYYYTFDNNQWILVSDQVNPNYVFCSIFDRFFTYNDERTGDSEVYLLDLLTGEEVQLSQGQQGRSSALVGYKVFFAEGLDIYEYDIATGARKSTGIQGSNLKGYYTGKGFEFLAFRSPNVGGITSIQVLMPQYDYLYQASSPDYYATEFDFYDGLVSWVEYRNGKQVVMAAYLYSIDSDGDGLLDIEEIVDYSSDPFSLDTDGDGFDDKVEVENGYSPISPSNTDGGDTNIETQTTEVDQDLVDRLVGKILLDVENRGEAWYVDPVTRKRYYMKDGTAAYALLRAFGLGITDSDLERIALHQNNPNDTAFARGLAGRILLQVEANGEAWYVIPDTLIRIYLADPNTAYEVMRQYGLGITSEDLSKIPVGRL